MTETWTQLIEQILARTPGVVNRDGDYFVPRCSYGALDLDENYDPTPERIASERLTESTYHEITTQLEVVWGPPDFQGDGAGSGLREWQDAAMLAYWKKRDDFAIVTIQAYDNTRLYSLALSVRSAAKLRVKSERSGGCCAADRPRIRRGRASVSGVDGAADRSTPRSAMGAGRLGRVASTVRLR